MVPGKKHKFPQKRHASFHDEPIKSPNRGFNPQTEPLEGVADGVMPQLKRGEGVKEKEKKKAQL